MIVYADNASALALRRASVERLQALLQQAFALGRVRILALQRHFWREGTHLHSRAPRKDPDNPHRIATDPLPPNVHVVGEAVSVRQGSTGPIIDAVRHDVTSSRIA